MYLTSIHYTILLPLVNSPVPSQLWRNSYSWDFSMIFVEPIMNSSSLGSLIIKDGGAKPMYPLKILPYFLVNLSVTGSISKNN